jgi:hypothetical protein
MPAQRFRRTWWKPGAVFGVPLADDRLSIAQAIAPMMENVIYVALLSDLIDSPSESLPPISRVNVISLIATWRQSLNNGSWASLGVEDLY